MAENVKDTVFSEVEYMFDKYYREHCAKVVASEMKAFNERQRLDHQKEYQEYMETYGHLGDRMPPYRPSGEWTQRSSEDLLRNISSRLSSSGAIAGDLTVLTSAWRMWAVDRLGQDRYGELSVASGGDLAEVYVENRLKQMAIGQIARSKAPKGSLDFIMRTAVENSTISWLTPSYVRRDDLDDRIDKMAGEMYDSSVLENVAGYGLSGVIDMAMLGGTGAAGTLGKGVRTAFALGKGKTSKEAAKVVVKGFFQPKDAVTKSVRAVEGVKRAGKVAGGVAATGGAAWLFSSCSSPDDVDREISRAVTGSEDGFSEARKDAAKLKSQHSRNVHVLNDYLNNKVKMNDFRKPFSPFERKQYESLISDSFKSCSSFDERLESVSDILNKYNTSVMSSNIPGWMMRKSAEDASHMSAWYCSILLEMKSCGADSYKINGKTYGIAQVAQMSYDYACAAAELERREHQGQVQDQQKKDGADLSSADVRQHIDEEGAARQGEGFSSDGTLLGKMNTAQQQWGGLAESFGLDGAGDMAGNLGYTLGMLPDMIYGMLSGKSKNLSIENNIFPLMCIFGGMFIRNPILRIMLLALGGINMLNKGFKEYSDVEQGRRQAVAFKSRPDEEVSQRIGGFEMIDGTDSATVVIDGTHYVINMDADTADAYRSGKVAKGALLNTVLDRFDEQASYASESYERLIAEREGQQESIRLGL